jgi:hypothetical protein
MTATILDQIDQVWCAAFQAAFGAAHDAQLLAGLRDERRETVDALQRLAHVYGALAWSSQLARADSAGRGGSPSGAAS